MVERSPLCAARYKTLLPGQNVVNKYLAVTSAIAAKEVAFLEETCHNLSSMIHFTVWWSTVG